MLDLKRGIHLKSGPDEGTYGTAELGGGVGGVPGCSFPPGSVFLNPQEI